MSHNRRTLSELGAGDREGLLGGSVREEWQTSKRHQKP